VVNFTLIGLCLKVHIVFSNTTKLESPKLGTQDLWLKVHTVFSNTTNLESPKLGTQASVFLGGREHGLPHLPDQHDRSNSTATMSASLLLIS